MSPSSVKRTPPSRSWSAEIASADLDAMQARRLVLGGTSEIAGTLVTDDLSPAERVTELLASNLFTMSAEAVLNGDLSAGADPAPVSVLDWARRCFDVDVSTKASRFDLLAEVMDAPAVAALLAKPDRSPLFEPNIFRALLRGEEGTGSKAPPSVWERLERDFRGLGIARIQDMEPIGERGVRFTSGDPALIMYLRPEAYGDAPAVELTFTVGGARKRTTGTLYIAYEEDFSEDRKITLHPRGRRVYKALLLGPSAISNIRWDPDDQPGEVWLASLTVRPVGFDELTPLLEEGGELPGFLSAMIASPHVRSAKLLDLSKRLTERLHGHGGRRQGDYAAWIEENELLPIEARKVWERQLETLKSSPLISVLVPTYETPPALLREMIESVLGQVYSNWELCIADDASKSPHVRDIIDGYAAQDDRIKVTYRPTNGHISEASNSGLELATGEWLALLDHDDLLTPNALLDVAAEIEAHPETQFIYSDEDKLDDKGIRYEPFFKPDFSPELLRSQNYLNHLSVHRTENVRMVGGWRKGFEGSQDYDLNLRTLERLERGLVRHIPKVLYHWRAVEGSTAKGREEKDYAFMAGFRALEEHVSRMQWNAEVQEVPGLPFYRVRYDLPDPAPMVSLIIPTRDRADLVETCVRSILGRTIYSNYEVLIVDNGSVAPETFALFAALTRDQRVRIVDAPGPFNYSRINNLAVAQSRGDVIGLVNNDIEVISPDWMREMASWAIQPRIGCVGAKLYYPDDTIQHAGVVLGMGGVAGHPHRLRHRSDPGYFGRAAVSHDVSAVTAACVFVRREIWGALGGLNEALQVAFNDIDFCLRVREAGYRNVWTPFAELYHHESVSRGKDEDPIGRSRFLGEVDYMLEVWGDIVNVDPYYSPNLSLDAEGYAFRI